MNIICLTDITGFPNGEATAHRIKMVGKAVISAGANFSLYTTYFNKLSYNNEWKGNCEGIYFEYLHKTTQMNISPAKKIFLIQLAFLRLLILLVKLSRKENVIYSFSHGKLFNLIIIVICKLFRFKIVQEINEWDYNPYKYTFRRFMFKGPMIKWSDGAIIISESIKNNVLEIKKGFPYIKIPILSDCELINPEFNENENKVFYGLWVGLLKDYLDDVLLFADALDIINKNSSLNIKGVVCGRFTQKSKEEIYKHINESDFLLKGYVSNEELHKLCNEASFFVAPLWKDQKSENRFPTKIATYLLYGKPVITCPVGEVKSYLTDDTNAIFFSCGDCEGLASKISYIYDNKEHARLIGKQGREFAEKNFDYKVYSVPLVRFFEEVVSL